MENKELKISVAIITKNRLSDLKDCLATLANQSIPVDELILIDSSGIKTRRKVKELCKLFPYKCRYLFEKKKGFPYARNRALSQARFDWIAFTDDDCLVEKSWLKRIKTATSKQPHAAAIMGHSETIYKDNPYALTSELDIQYWKQPAIKNNSVMDLEILDNKNVIYNKKFLASHNISYDESRVDKWHGASDDCDLGMQIFVAGGKASFCKKIIVYHKDPTSLYQYFKHKYLRTQGHLNYERKWQTIRRKIKLRRDLFAKIKIVTSFIKRNKLSLNLSSTTIFLLILTQLFVKSIKFYSKIKDLIDVSKNKLDSYELLFKA